MSSTVPTERASRSNNTTLNAMTVEERREYMRDLARRSHAERRVLGGDERAELGDALRRIYADARAIAVRLDVDLDGEGADDGT